MNLLDLFVKIGVEDNASSPVKKIGSAIGTGLKTACSVGIAAVGAAASAIGALGTEAIKSYADYEQLVGGVETLFGLGGQTLEEYAESVGQSTDEALDAFMDLTTGQRIVLNNADKAFKTAGLSANEYMETVTSFSASLLQSLGGDTIAAANLADQAIIDMSDNANKMGTDMQSIQNAYSGFAKSNYTMLDNLNNIGALAA